MPVSQRTSANLAPEHFFLRPYTFHGVDLSIQSTHAVGDCPFCGREGKFSVEVATGLWRCLVCGTGTAAGGGNGLVFTRMIYQNAASEATSDPGAKFRASVAADRRLLDHSTVSAWGVVEASDGTWLVPGYGTDGKLDQVYRRTRIQEKDSWVWRLLPTPGIWPEGKVHTLHMPVADFSPSCPKVVVCEGPWDGMALYELWGDEDNNIVAVPGCNVWRDEWTEMCRGKQVILMFDSDHPREYVKGRVSTAGYDGMVRVAKRLSGVAASVRWLRWGPDGYDPDKPSGWDVRDHMAETDDRRAALTALLDKIEDAPTEWFNSTPSSVNGYAHAESMPCSTFGVCEVAWADAMHWRTDLSDALAVLLAVCASTQQAGNQLFLDLVGSPGSAKTTICKGLLTSAHCVHLENMSKLISGYKLPDDATKDCSFIARSNNKTWVTCEFDTILSSGQYTELMGKIRRIFDGETSSTYGNSDKDRIYAALRTPWVRAGTHRMMDQDQSQLGDRFLRFILSDPSDEEKRAIMRKALQSERIALLESANGMSGSVVDAKTRLAQALTGGYVDYLRAHVEEELGRVDVPESAEDYCLDLAELSADLRARPNEDKRKLDAHDSKELPTRLARQNVRLASCLAVVLNKHVVDSDILRILRKVALDTAEGHSLHIVQWMCRQNPQTSRPYQEGGIGDGLLKLWLEMTDERLARYLGFLKKIDVLRRIEATQGHGTWCLTDRVYDLYLRVTSNANS